MLKVKTFNLPTVEGSLSQTTTPASASARWPVAVRLGDQLEQVAVGGVEVDAAAAPMVVDLARPFLVGTGEIGEPGILHPSEGCVEFLVVDQEGVMLGAHILGIDEVERDTIAGLDWPKRPPLRSDIHAQDIGQEFCRSILVLGRNDDVVEGWHGILR